MDALRASPLPIALSQSAGVAVTGQVELGGTYRLEPGWPCQLERIRQRKTAGVGSGTPAALIARRRNV